MIEPTLRERAARAAFDAFSAEGTESSAIEHDLVLQVADAVMRVLPVDPPDAETGE